LRIITFVTLICILASCQKTVQEMSTPPAIGAELTNYALLSRGARVFVSEDNFDHPAETLANGITASDNWDAGEGWEVYFDDIYDHATYTVHGEESLDAERLSAEMRQAMSENANPAPVEGDYMSSGLGYLGFSRMIPTAMGWVVFELPEPQALTRVDIYTLDSEKYPASQYGVRTLSVQYWSEAGWWENVTPLDRKVDQKNDTIRKNTAGHMVVRFQPVLTSRIRVVIRWTNDTETYSRTRGYHREVRGTIRLTEIEIYGFKDRSQFTGDGSGDAVWLDTLFTPSQKGAAPMLTDARPRAEIEEVIQTYADAYSHRDLPRLMETISPNYAKAAEDYDALKAKLQRLFEAFSRIAFSLERIQVEVSGESATVTADYRIVLTRRVGESTAVEGRLFFTLTQTESGWQIVRIAAEN